MMLTSYKRRFKNFLRDAVVEGLEKQLSEQQKQNGSGQKGNSSKPVLDLPRAKIFTMTQWLYLQRMFQKIQNLEGDIVECGVGRGQTFLFWVMLSYDEATGRRIWGFDSFEGFPEPGEEDESTRNPQKGEWNYCEPSDILAMLHEAGFESEFARRYVTLVKGFFEESLPKYSGNRIALLHLDGDLYQSYKASLELLYPKVVKNGVIMFDEYLGTMEHQNYPGAHQAIDEFFADKDEEILRDQQSGKYYLIKKG